jgi:hypothetical protein
MQSTHRNSGSENIAFDAETIRKIGRRSWLHSALCEKVSV